MFKNATPKKSLATYLSTISNVNVAYEGIGEIISDSHKKSTIVYKSRALNSSGKKFSKVNLFVCCTKLLVAFLVLPSNRKIIYDKEP